MRTIIILLVLSLITPSFAMSRVPQNEPAPMLVNGMMVTCDMVREARRTMTKKELRDMRRKATRYQLSQAKKCHR